MEMKIQMTAHDTIRVWIPKIIISTIQKVIFDKLSIWNGMDKSDKLYWSWEMPKEFGLFNIGHVIAQVLRVSIDVKETRDNMYVSYNIWS